MKAARRVLLVVALAAFSVLLFKHISYPLMWQDEAETALFAGRILDYGYPKIHGPKNVLYEFGADNEIGRKEETDAYIGTTWGHFYFAVPGLIWARGTEDLYARTARLRLPFATAGLLGVLCFALVALPALGSDRERKVLFLALYLALCCFSISLILHLREVRYYGLQILLGAAIFSVYVGYQVYGRLGFGSYAGWMAALLVLLFHVFYSAYLSIGFILGAHCLYVGWASADTWRERTRRAGLGLVPFLVSAILLLPFFVYFETLAVASRFSEQMGLTGSIFWENLLTIIGHLRIHEMLVPAIVVRTAVPLVASEERVPWPERDVKRRVAALLVGIAVGYLVIVSVNPLAFERYFLVLSPVFTLAFLLDAFTLVEIVPRRYGLGRRGGTLVAAALATLVLATGVGRIRDLTGRVREISRPVVGPVDYLVEHLRERFPRTEHLIIATNYEAHPLMFYLGSHVIVGYSRNNIEVDRTLEPDVLVPRRAWPYALPDLVGFLQRGDFESIRLPIADLPYNNIPALTKTRAIPGLHRFETVWSSIEHPPLVVHHRVSPPESSP